MAFLEVLTSPGNTPPAGTRLELERPSLAFDIGSDPGLKMRLDSPAVVQRHCRVERSGGFWSLRSLHFAPGTWLDGVRLRSHQPRQLAHGSVIELTAGGLVLGYGERGALWPREEGLEASLAEAPAEDMRWMVYSDFLQEQGDGLGAAMAKAPFDEPTTARHLGVLARSWLVDEFSMNVNRFGFATRVQLRPGFAREDALAPRVLELLGDSKLVHFIEALDLGLFIGAPEPRERWLERARVLLGALARARPLPALRTVTLGHAPDSFPMPELDEDFGRVKERHPRAAAGSPLVAESRSLALRLVACPRRLYVEGMDVGGRRVLERSSRHTLGGKPGLTFALKGTFGVRPPPGLLVISGRSGPWTLARSTGADAASVRVNGHDVEQQVLVMPGDELEFGLGLRFRFELP